MSKGKKDVKCVSVPQSKPAAFTGTEFWGQWEKHCLNCLSLIKDDMELIYFFLVTRGFERFQEDHQDIIFNIPKKSHLEKRNPYSSEVSV